ncbi:efflux RND transporter periplasmic adaptor subunit [Ralstonia solanacearum]
MPEQPAAALTVTVAAASQTQWPATLEASGAIAPWQEAVIGAQVSGLRLADVRVNVGDRVKRGQVLAVFDADLLRADEARLKAGWQQAEANRERALKLKGSGGISEQDVLQYVTQADVSKAQLRSTQLQLRYAEVIAPDDGVISARSATVGTVSNTGQELFRMIRQSRLEWRGELTAAQLAQVKAGQHIRLALPDGSAATAMVRQTAPSLDSQTRLGIVYADIEPGSGARGHVRQGECGVGAKPRRDRAGGQRGHSRWPQLCAQAVGGRSGGLAGCYGRPTPRRCGGDRLRHRPGRQGCGARCRIPQ